MTKLLPTDCLDILVGEFHLDGQAQIAKFLDISQPRVSQINNSKNLTKTHIKKFLKRAFWQGRQEGHGATSTKLLDSFGAMRHLETQAELAKALDKTQGAVAQWKRGSLEISAQTIERILKAATQLTIQPLVEMEEVDPGQPGASQWYFYSAKTNTKRSHLLKKLRHKRGIYIYFDATGRPTYIGKADETTLDKESENRLTQEIKKGRIAYGKNMKRAPRLRQGEITRYLSAYAISPREAIPLVEALLIRTTGNIQYNKRLERLSE